MRVYKQEIVAHLALTNVGTGASDGSCYRVGAMF